MQKIIISVVLGALLFGVYKVATRNATPAVTTSALPEADVQIDSNRELDESNF